MRWVVVRTAFLLSIVTPTGAIAQGEGRGRILDAHVHLNDAAAWVRLMDEANVEWSIAFAGRKAGNAALLEAAARWPGRFRPFLSVSPEFREYRPYWEAGDTTLIVIADSLLATGRFYGIGEVSVTHFPSAGFPEADFDPGGSIMRGLLGLARKYKVPITVHVEVTRLRELDALLRDFRDVPVIWAHGGYTPLYIAERMLDEHPNLVYELSARTWARHPRSPDYTILQDGNSVWPQWRDLVQRKANRFIVGTDAAGRSMESDRAKVQGLHSFLDQLTPEAARLVGSVNLERLLRPVPGMRRGTRAPL